VQNRPCGVEMRLPTPKFLVAFLTFVCRCTSCANNYKCSWCLHGNLCTEEATQCGIGESIVTWSNQKDDDHCPRIEYIDPDILVSNGTTLEIVVALKSPMVSCPGDPGEIVVMIRRFYIQLQLQAGHFPR